MYLDVVDLRDYYTSLQGQVTRRFLTRQLRQHFSNVRGCRLAGIGFATPYLRPYLGEAERVLALMPARQGVTNWPPEGPNASALVHAHDLPLPDASLDRVLLVHALELVANPHDLLREIWRVLAPGGRLLAVVPNRKGLWARIETTPFGHGRPFSRGQTVQMLREALFTPSQWSHALHFLPLKGKVGLSSARAFEELGQAFWPGFGGVLIVEATKQLYQGLPSREPGRSRLRRPLLLPPAAVPSRFGAPDDF